ncbi:MAG: SIS domain-containing protein, partial [Enterobacter sp.]|nr:SIS domain-containing protein [Enterobacter sp.]
PYARRFQELNVEVSSQLREADDAQNGEVAFGCGPAPAASLIPAAVGEFHRLLPQARVRFQIDNWLALHQAQSVQIYGVAASAILGEYLHYKLLRLGKPAQLFSDMHRAAMNATTLSSETLVVAISSSGSTRDLLHVVKLARKRGVKVLALSNTPRSPLASLSDMQLVAAKPEGPLSAGALNAKVGVMLLVELLTTSMIALDGRYGDVSQQTASATLPLLL